jgi:hypothetical protein
VDKLVIDHSYSLGMAWDQTPFRNHGLVHQAMPGTGYTQGAFSFAPGRTWPGAAIVVPPAKSLQRIGAVRIRARVLTTSKGGGAQRQNIVEGHLSFAFFVNPDLSLQGTFLSPSNNWTGIRTPPRAIVPNKWFQVEFWYDGISAAQILVDGVAVADAYDPASQQNGTMTGPVRGVGAHGVFIGHWPEKDDRYTFDGFIRDVQFFKRDDEEDLLKLLDPCCLRDLREVYKAGEDLRKQGYDLRYGRKVLDEIVAAGTELMGSWRGGDAQATQELNDLMRQFLHAVRHRNSTPLGPSLRPLLEWVADHASSSELTNTSERMTKLLEGLPLKPEQILELGNKLCFGKLKDGIEEEVKRLDKDPRWQERRKRRAPQKDAPKGNA